MIRMFIPALLLLVLGACYQNPDDDKSATVTADVDAAETAAGDDPAAAMEAARQAFQDAATPEEKVAVARDFLRRYPESDATLDALDNALQQLIEELDDPAGAESLVADLRGRIEDAELDREVALRLAQFYARDGRRDELRRLAADLAAEGELGYDGHAALARAAEQAGDWELMLRHAEASMPYATAAAYRADRPDVDAETAAHHGQRRLANAHAYRGRALAELDRHDEALAAFRAGESHVTYSYLGADNTPLHRYWGQALLERGEVDAAIEKLTPGGLFGTKDDRAALVAALRARGDDPEATIWRLRRERAKPIDDFALADYEGNELRSSELSGEVVLLAFWHPT